MSEATDRLRAQIDKLYAGEPEFQATPSTPRPSWWHPIARWNWNERVAAMTAIVNFYATRGIDFDEERRRFDAT